eukprot:gene12873-14198_t
MDYLNETFTGSQQNNTDKHDYWKKSTFSLKSILPAYLIILLICLTGNCLVCLTVWRNKNMRSRWYSLLVTLSVADMGLALTTPIQLLQFANVDIGDAGCKCSIFVLDVFFGTGMLVLAYLSLDRYHGICRPPLKVGERRVRAAIILPLIWLAISLTYAPMLFACRRSTKAGSLSCDCHTAWPKEEHYVVYSFFIVFATYIMPFSTMSLCYYKICQNLWKNTKENSVLPSADPTGSKRRSIKMLIITTAFFFACWTPYNCLYVLKKLKLSWASPILPGIPSFIAYSAKISAEDLSQHSPVARDGIVERSPCPAAVERGPNQPKAPEAEQLLTLVTAVAR